MMLADGSQQLENNVWTSWRRSWLAFGIKTGRDFGYSSLCPADGKFELECRGSAALVAFIDVPDFPLRTIRIVSSKKKFTERIKMANMGAFQRCGVQAGSSRLATQQRCQRSFGEHIYHFLRCAGIAKHQFEALYQTHDRRRLTSWCRQWHCCACGLRDVIVRAVVAPVSIKSAASKFHEVVSQRQSLKVRSAQVS